MHSGRAAQPTLLGIVTILYETSWVDEARDQRAVIDLACKLVRAEPHLAGIAFPAGTLVVGRGSDANAAAEGFLAALPRRRPVVVWGVDIRTKGTRPVKVGTDKGTGVTKEWDRNKDPVLPWYGYVATPKGDRPIWGTRQLAYRSTQSVFFQRLPHCRSFRLGDRDVGLLMCGELMARVSGRGRNIDHVRQIVDRQDVVIDIAHANVAIRGLVRWATAMEEVASSGKGRRPVFVAQHLAADCLKRSLRMYTTKGEAPKLASAGSRHVRRTPVGMLTSGLPAALIDVYEVG